MMKIYCITDCNNKKYVGKTKLELYDRLFRHKSQKCSSQLLNLNDCKIELLEECNKENSKERERYWINHLDCVNKRKLNFDEIAYKREYSKERDFFRRKDVCDGFYNVAKMLEQF